MSTKIDHDYIAKVCKKLFVIIEKLPAAGTRTRTQADHGCIAQMLIHFFITNEVFQRARTPLNFM